MLGRRARAGARRRGRRALSRSGFDRRAHAVSAPRFDVRGRVRHAAVAPAGTAPTAPGWPPRPLFPLTAPMTARDFSGEALAPIAHRPETLAEASSLRRS